MSRARLMRKGLVAGLSGVVDELREAMAKRFYLAGPRDRKRVTAARRGPQAQYGRRDMASGGGSRDRDAQTRTPGPRRGLTRLVARTTLWRLGGIGELRERGGRQRRRGGRLSVRCATTTAVAFQLGRGVVPERFDWMPFSHVADGSIAWRHRPSPADGCVLAVAAILLMPGPRGFPATPRRRAWPFERIALPMWRCCLVGACTSIDRSLRGRGRW